MSTVPLALLLLRASRWFDRQLLDRLRREGWPALTPAQSLVFAHLDENGVPPAELARRLGSSRQGLHQMLNALVTLDLLRLQPNPARRGGLLVTLTDSGAAMTRAARRVLSDLERELGCARAAELRTLLADFDPARDRVHC